MKHYTTTEGSGERVFHDFSAPDHMRIGDGIHRYRSMSDPFRWYTTHVEPEPLEYCTCPHGQTQNIKDESKPYRPCWHVGDAKVQERRYRFEQSLEPVHACLDGWHYIGYQDDDGAEKVEAVRCRRCASGEGGARC